MIATVAKIADETMRIRDERGSVVGGVVIGGGGGPEDSVAVTGADGLEAGEFDSVMKDWHHGLERKTRRAAQGWVR